MKSIKVLSATVVAALALVALAAATSASASVTLLCKENVSACPMGSILGGEGGTAVTGTLKSGTSWTIANEGLLGNETCTGSTLTAKTTAKEGSQVPLSVSAMTLSGCGKCEHVEMKSLPYSGSLERTSGGNGKGSVTSTSLKYSGCTFGVTCTYTANLPFTFEGGSANLVIKEAAVTVQEPASAFCPKTGKLSATYEITTPNPVYLTGKVEKEVKKTVVCKVAEELCPEGAYNKTGTLLKATIDKIALKQSDESVFNFNFECGGSMSAELSANSGEPSLPLNPISMKPEGCNFCAMSVHPFEGSLRGTGVGDGILTAPIEIQFTSPCTISGLNYVCTIGSKALEFELQGAGKASKLQAKEGQTLEYISGGSGCKGIWHHVVMNFSFTSPSFWVAEGGEHA